MVGELRDGETESERDTGEIGTSQPSCRCPDDAAGGGREGGGEDEPDGERQVRVVDLDIGIGVGTYGHQGGVAEGDLSSSSDEQGQPGDNDGVSGDFGDIEVGKARDLHREQVAGDAAQ